MRQRFEDKLRVDIQIEPGVREALTPHLLLQPLVENCIRHGIDPQSNAVEVTVTAARENGSTLLRVRDHGRGMPKGHATDAPVFPTPRNVWRNSMANGIGSNSKIASMADCW